MNEETEITYDTKSADTKSAQKILSMVRIVVGLASIIGISSAALSVWTLEETQSTKFDIQKVQTQIGTREKYLGDIQTRSKEINEEVDKLRGAVTLLSELPEEAKRDIALATITQKLASTQKRVDELGALFKADPNQLISIALLKRDMTIIEEKLTDSEADIGKAQRRLEEELGRVYNLIVTILGVLLTIGAGVIGFLWVQFFRITGKAPEARP